MHEMGIANSILEAVRSEAGRFPGSRPIKVGVRLGELAAIDPESLRFCLDALILETDLEGLSIEMEWIERRHRCRGCRREFVVRDYNFECPGCRGLNSECIAGDELELAFVEVEEHEPIAVGTQDSE
jgi:hydrogenase nickel incorporation protein HypA/HybF